MNNLKFRIWDAYLKKMTVPNDETKISVEFCNGKLSDFYVEEETIGWGPIPIDIERGNRFFAQQCTGLTDAAGNFIYEGDIVRWADKFNYKVYWLDCDVMFDLACLMDDDSFIEQPNLYWKTSLSLKVIGNIFEN